MSAFEYQLNRSSRRKTLSIVIRRGQVKVLAPQFVPLVEINRFIADKTPWILAKLQIQQQWVVQSQKQYVDGETFMLAGEALTLQIQVGRSSEIVRQGQCIVISVPLRVSVENRRAYCKRQLQLWLKQLLSTYLDHRLGYFANHLGVDYQSVKVRHYKRRWGSCSSRGELSFNYILSQTPDWVIDYVIVHELAHRLELNHSARFWQIVSRYYPHHQQAKAYLDQHAALLTLD